MTQSSAIPPEASKTTASESPADNSVKEPQTLDEILIAMDIVDTLRHREQLVLQELNEEARETELIARLKDIYSAQGIAVDEATLRDGVKALEENRFVYTPPKSSFQVKLAYIYVKRDKWLKPLTGSLAALFLGATFWYFGVTAPKAASEKAAFVELNKELPTKLEAARDKVQSSTDDVGLQSIAETYYQDGVAAAETGQAANARAALKTLSTLQSDIEAQYKVRIVSRPNEYSGLFRVSETNTSIRNYYLIVEAIDPAGRVIAVPVNSEESQSAKRVSIWGVRVPKSVFDAVSADKKDDQIIQKAVIGTKTKGDLLPSYSVDTLDGAIFEW